MTKINFKINSTTASIDTDPDMPLLWAIRDELKLTGTKFGCGKALCGACSVHIDGNLVRSCSYPVGQVAGKTVRTIEGLSTDEVHLHPVQAAWLELQVPQCGYCQSGFMMAAAKLLEENANPTEAEIKDNISNICRCGTHPRIIKAILKAAEIKRTPNN
jgi:isoquinoline 1-oxidoreductase subunit alpha